VRRVLLDSGPWIALFLGRDNAHNAAVSWLEREAAGMTLISTWPVLTEVCFFLNAVGKQSCLSWVERGAVTLLDLTSADRGRMQSLIGQFKDQMPDLADASLLAVAERLTIRQIATFDLQDFNVYRIHGKQKLQLESFDAPSVKNPQRKSRR
jgi:uncharacterized protein